MVVAFTGHRPNKLGGYRTPNPIYNWVTWCIQEQLEELKPTLVISGMALGVDQWAAQIAHDMGIPFLAAIPFQGQEKAWPAHSQAAFKNLLLKSCEIVVVSPGEYTPYKMRVRNAYMVDRCDSLIAVWDGTPGGTGNCVEYAEACGKQIVRIKPR